MEKVIVIKRKIVRSSAKKKALPDPEYDRILWAIKARFVDSKQRSISNVKIENKKIIATNGHILFIAKFETEYPDGEYAVLFSSWRFIVLERKDPESSDLPFPQYEKVVPIDKPIETIPLSTDLYRAFNNFCRIVYSRGLYNLEFLQLAFMSFGDLKIEFRERTKPLIVKEVQGDGEWFRMALVMPIKEQ